MRVFAGRGSSRELAARVGPCGKGMRGVGNRPVKARRFGRHTGVRAEGVGRERDVATLEGSGGARPPGPLRGLDAEGNGEPSAGEARGPGFGECHSNCMGGRWWGGGQLVPLEKPRAVKRPAGGRSLAPNPSSATHELCDPGRVT